MAPCILKEPGLLAQTFLQEKLYVEMSSPENSIRHLQEQ